MKQILKTITFGIILGATAFFIPFIFKFILALMIIGFVFKMILGGGRRRHFANRFEGFDHNYSPIVPIDNQWYKPTVQGNGSVNQININYNHESI
ncbi:hypothetical protein DU508_06545 [Pedobacter chinensis]|uniref:Uncharacterized protein n=1 Tax=Pedobacter chinensis TaxID=2282421 RepID=A0A369Q1H5_9SPHI|nr:hypothetical protein [Pedobacter chinensis]RDC56856.1 hypothetical protein DU508_06545 [Pedobacter chinensis]